MYNDVVLKHHSSIISCLKVFAVIAFCHYTAIVQPSLLDLTAEVGQLLHFSCTSPCGLQGWEINHESIDNLVFHGPATDPTHKVYVCSGDDECVLQQFLDCDNAAEGVYLKSNMQLRTNTSDLIVQCVSSIEVSNKLYPKYSKAVWIHINHTGKQPTL